MGTMELEIKILNINKKEFISKLNNLGATFIEEGYQKLYVYDLPSIYGRFIDLLTILNTKSNTIRYTVALQNLKLLFWEIDNLLTDTQKSKLFNLTNSNCLESLIDNTNLITYINDSKFIEFIKNQISNPKKWIRVRETNGKVTMNVKHILAPNNTSLQQMMESEVSVSSMDDATAFLNALGYSYRSYQEKYRTTYQLNGYLIEIDTWPNLPTYFEIEGSSVKDLNNILGLLGYSVEDGVSCTPDVLYKKIGIDINNMRELKF